jgi:hypothetical protein
MPLASSPPPIRDKKLNQQTIAMARVFQQTAGDFAGVTFRGFNAGLAQREGECVIRGRQKSRNIQLTSAAAYTASVRTKRLSKILR